MRAKLPPGQRAIDHFPRFGVPAYASRLPERPARFELRLRLRNAAAHAIPLEDLEQLGRREVVADFHCVTTWTSTNLHWSGFSFRDFYDRFVAPRASASDTRCVEFTALDGHRTSILLEDLFEADVLLADRLEGEPLSAAHGAPLRLVAPSLYGYKSIKHVCTIAPRAELRPGPAERQTRAHPRGRVAFEERGRGLPGWAYRAIYRTLLGPTLCYYRRVQVRPSSKN